MSFIITVAILPEHPGCKATNGNNHPYYPKEKSVAKNDNAYNTSSSSEKYEYRLTGNYPS